MVRVINIIDEFRRNADIACKQLRGQEGRGLSGADIENFKKEADLMKYKMTETFHSLFRQIRPHINIVQYLSTLKIRVT